MFEISEGPKVKHKQNSHYLAIGHFTGTITMTFPITG
jgi:hypothetical protein